MGTCGAVPKVKEDKKDNPITIFRDEILKKHNEIRKTHGSPELTLNIVLNNMAQNYAKQILDSKGRKAFPINTYNDSAVGENVIISSKKEPNEIFEKWYNEKNLYDFSLNKFQKGTGHFTQIVWKTTKEVGFGLEADDKNNICCVALYYPGGNVIGEFSSNVTDNIKIK